MNWIKSIPTRLNGWLLNDANISKQLLVAGIVLVFMLFNVFFKII